jgi:hypothetical protein
MGAADELCSCVKSRKSKLVEPGGLVATFAYKTRVCCHEARNNFVDT